MARCYILVSISSVLQYQLKNYFRTRDMILREHVLKLFDYLNTREILGGEIDAESQIDIILESLPNYFN